MFETLLSMWEGYVVGNDLLFNYGFGFIDAFVTGALEALIGIFGWL